MKVVLEVRDDKAAFILELLNSFPCVKKAERVKSEKEILIEEIKEAVEEIKLVRAGKKKAKNADDFLNEL